MASTPQSPQPTFNATLFASGSVRPLPIEAETRLASLDERLALLAVFVYPEPLKLATMYITAVNSSDSFEIPAL
jgi:hypothetical protein